MIPFANIATSINAMQDHLNTDITQYSLEKHGGSCAQSAYYYKDILTDFFETNNIKANIIITNVIAREREKEKEKDGILGHHTLLIEIDNVLYEYDHHLWQGGLVRADGGKIERAIYKRTEKKPLLVSSEIMPDGRRKVTDSSGREFYYNNDNSPHLPTFVQGLHDSKILVNRLKRILKDNPNSKPDPFIIQGAINEIRKTLIVNFEDLVNNKNENPLHNLFLSLGNTSTINTKTKGFEETLSDFLTSFKNPIIEKEFQELLKDLQKITIEINKKYKYF